MIHTHSSSENCWLHSSYKHLCIFYFLLLEATKVQRCHIYLQCTSTDSGPRDPRPADRLTVAVSEAAGKRRKEEGGAVGLSGTTILN